MKENSKNILNSIHKDQILRPSRRTIKEAFLPRPFGRSKDETFAKRGVKRTRRKEEKTFGNHYNIINYFYNFLNLIQYRERIAFNFWVLSAGGCAKRPGWWRYESELVSAQARFDHYLPTAELRMQMGCRAGGWRVWHSALRGVKRLVVAFASLALRAKKRPRKNAKFAWHQTGPRSADRSLLTANFVLLTANFVLWPRISSFWWA